MLCHGNQISVKRNMLNDNEVICDYFNLNTDPIFTKIIDDIFHIYLIFYMSLEHQTT
jgi:hypothetical protein